MNLSPRNLILSALILSVVIQIPKWAQNKQSSEPALSQIRQMEQDEKNRDRQLRAESRVAIQRYRNGCLPVESETSNLLQGDSVITTSTGQAVKDGTTVCHGKTTAIVVAGTAQNVARVGLEDMETFNEIRAKIEQTGYE